MTRPTAQPSAMPNTPPSSPISDASTRKICRTSASPPPIAFITPISRVLSRIDITIVLTMPSEATVSAIDPTRPSSRSSRMKAFFWLSSRSAIEKALKPMSLIFFSTASVSCARFTLTVTVA